MSKVSDNSEKILVRYYSNVLDKMVAETLWAEIIDYEKGLYRINNIPFYGPECSSGDMVFAEYDNDEEMITFRNVIEPSGNSTIQVVVLDENLNVDQLRNECRALGCETEANGTKYFVMEIPFNQNYNPIFSILSELEDAEKISFAEPNISEKHLQEKN